MKTKPILAAAALTGLLAGCTTPMPSDPGTPIAGQPSKEAACGGKVSCGASSSCSSKSGCPAARPQ